jgi:glycosyltransferase involved in cell wall biosynthesis
MNLVVFRHPLWENSNNGSITCLINFLQEHRITESPWILIVLKRLEFDLNNKYQCNEKCLKTLKNQIQNFYVYDYKNRGSILELSQHLCRVEAPSFNFFSVDSIGGYFCHQLREIIDPEKKGYWTHLSTLHNTKNIKVLEDTGIISGGISQYGEEFLKEKTFVDGADNYVVVSKSEWEWVRDVLGRESKPIKIYYPTLSWWSELIPLQGKGDPFYIREKYPTRKIFLYIGRITYQKNIDKLLEVVWPENSHLCIMSALEFCDFGLLEKVKEFCEKNKDKASWIGPYYGSSKFDAIKGCDAVIVPSIYEPFGLVGLETMAFTDTIFMTSGVDGMKDYITEGGYIDCGTTVEKIQGAIKTFMAMATEEKGEMISKGKNHATRFLSSSKTS